MPQQNSPLDKLEKVSRSGVRDRVYDQIQEMLLCGDIPPGESMPIRTLAERLGTSPMPVREALRQLLSEQGIEMHSNRTFRVPVMTLPEALSCVTAPSPIRFHAVTPALLTCSCTPVPKLKCATPELPYTDDAS